MNRENSHQLDRQEIAIRYLLETLSEEEQIRLEEEFSVGGPESEEIEMAEDELIDRYVRNELSARDKSRFEERLISRRLTERVELAKLLATRADAPKPVSTPSTPTKLSWWQKLFGPL